MTIAKDIRDFFEPIIDCPYKKRCRSAGSLRCRVCKHNKAYEDHYDPR